MAKSHTKVKSYKKTNGKRVKAHIRKTTMDDRFRSAGKGLSRQLSEMMGSHKQRRPSKSKVFSTKHLKRSLNKLVRKTRNANKRKHI